MDRTDSARSLKDDFGFTDECIGRFDASDIISFDRYLRQLQHDPAATFSVVGENRQFTVHRFDAAMARADLGRPRSRRQPLPRTTMLVADYASPGFIIIFSAGAGKKSPAIPLSETPEAPAGGRCFLSGEKAGGTEITFVLSNLSFQTLIRNIFETFTANRLFPFFTEILEIAGEEKGVRNVLKCRFFFKSLLSKEVLSSIESDFARYLQADLRFMSIFDIIGPSMVGPSSSHTAGACRIGLISRSIFTAMKKGGVFGRIDAVSVKLIGSFRDTGVGHRTPSAIAGGLWGFRPDDERIMKYGDPVFLETNPIEIAGGKASFKGFIKGSTEDDQKYSSERSSNIAEVTVFTDKGESTVTGFSLGGGNVEVRYIDGRRLSEPLTGKEEPSLRDILGEGFPSTNVEKVIPGRPWTAPSAERPEFNTFEEVAEYCSSEKKGILEAALESESKLRGVSGDEIFSEMRGYWQIMKDGIAKGLLNREFSPFRMSGGGSARIAAYSKTNRNFDNLYGRAAAYATAVNEINACSRVIVAAPTAGSCGIIPGVLKAYEETSGIPESKILEALVIAGFLGMILFDDVSTAGADYGCQAEVGAAAAMAAGGIVHIEGGSASQVIHAFTLALKNCMGLVCDPVAGLVEVPCVKRNGIFTSVALTSAMMAMSGVTSFVSPDEVVLAVREVGEKLHRDYKETAGGGLARTRDGLRVASEFRKEVDRFFSD